MLNKLICFPLVKLPFVIGVPNKNLEDYRIKIFFVSYTCFSHIPEVT